jgi:hypothetical protein
VIDITNPASPQIVGSADTPGGAQDVALSGAHAYVADDFFGLQVIDITNPASPQIVGSVDTPDHAWDVAVSGTYAYVGGYGSDLHVIDITNPASPQIVGSVDTPDYPSDVAVSGTYVYVAGLGSGLQVIDVANPANPRIVGGRGTLSIAYGVAISGNLAYIACYDHFQVLPTQCRLKKSELAFDGDPPSAEQGVLVRAWPNPAIGSVSLSFDVPATENASVRIFDVRGRHVRSLNDSRFSRDQVLTWDGTDDQGRAVASGTYFVRLNWREETAISRVMIIR